MVTKAKSTAKVLNEVVATEGITDPRHLSYVKAVREYAQDHYNDSDMAWDEIVEAWTDEEIVKETAFCRSPEGAVRKIAGIAALRGSYRNEIINA